MMNNLPDGDMTALSLDSSALRAQSRTWRGWIYAWFLRPIILGTVVAAILVGIGIGWLGSWNAVAAWLRNDALVVDSREVSFGDTVATKDADASFVITNISTIPITIWGAQTTCGCISARLPRTIAPREKITLTFTIKTKERDIGQELRHQALLYLNVPSRPIVLVMRGSVTREGKE
jgi:Protein of unknown function (DUF1573)